MKALEVLRSVRYSYEPMRAWALRNWIFVVIALTYAYFYQGGDMNTNVRLALTRSIVERHALDVTPYHTLSIDNGYFQGKYYSDKAPGISLLATVPYGLMRAAEKVAHLDPDQPEVRATRVHALVIVFAVLPGVLAAALLRWAAERLSIRTPTATLLAVGYAWGTSAFAYSTMLFGHQLAAALVLGAFCLFLQTAQTERTERARGTLLLFGALISWAWIVEYPTAFLSIVLGCSLLADTAPRAWLRTIAWIFLGASPALAVHALYAFLCYGSPWALPYQYVVEPVFRSHTSSGLFGIGIPTRDGLVGISISAYRGLFFYCPWLVLVFAGFGQWIRAGSLGKCGKCVLALIALHVTFAASYYAWDGGLATGPRHLVPLLPFLILPIAYFADRGRWQTLVTGLAILVSMLIMLPIVAVTPLLPFGDLARTNPLYAYVLPALVRGELANNWIDPYATGAHRDVSYNLGQLAGLPVYLSLWLPLAACLGTWGVSLRRAMAKE